MTQQPEFKIVRTFKAPRELVWKAWTDPALFGKWFGPKGFTSKVKTFDFRVGGVLHSCISNGSGIEMWGKFVYREIIPYEKLVWQHSFSNEAGDLTRHPLNQDWPLKLITTVLFEDEGKDTKITLTWVPFEASEAETKVFADNMPSMKGGWTGTFEQLDAFLA